MQNYKTTLKSVYILKYFKILNKETFHFDYVSSKKNTVVHESW